MYIVNIRSMSNINVNFKEIRFIAKLCTSLCDTSNNICLSYGNLKNLGLVT